MVTLLESILLAIYIAVLLVVSHWIGQQAYSWLPPQATAEARHIDDLFSLLTSIGTFILFGLGGIILYSILFYRAPKGDFSEGHPARSNTTIELVWLIAPTIVVLWLVGQNFNIYQQLNIAGLQQVVHLHHPLEAEPVYAASAPAPLKPADETIQVDAKQWVWTFRYPNNKISHELHLPVNESTRLDLHAKDVIHGFYVPAFRLKQDIIPQRNIALVVTPIRSGKYRLQDSQFSGTDFAFMQADVYVESRQDYQQWLLAEQSETEPIAPERQASKPFFNSGWAGSVPPESIANRSSQSGEKS
ncbi:MAG TPA: cytochrome c oxidase subunit II [Leptolyngbya sp.]|nr:cytochrome c oxidase subunit II [Leptolyngbya sp.]